MCAARNFISSCSGLFCFFFCGISQFVLCLFCEWGTLLEERIARFFFFNPISMSIQPQFLMCLGLPLLFKNLFIWLCWVFVASRAFSSSEQGLPSCCGVQASPCSFSCCRAWALGYTGFSNYEEGKEKFALTGVTPSYTLGELWTVYLGGHGDKTATTSKPPGHLETRPG